MGPNRFKQHPIGAGPYKLVRQEPRIKLEFEAFEEYYRRVHIKQLVMIGAPKATTRVVMLERKEADIDPEERQRLVADIQRNILENLYLVPVFRHAFMNAIGPRIAAEKW